MRQINRDKHASIHTYNHKSSWVNFLWHRRSDTLGYVRIYALYWAPQATGHKFVWGWNNSWGSQAQFVGELAGAKPLNIWALALFQLLTRAKMCLSLVTAKHRVRKIWAPKTATHIRSMLEVKDIPVHEDSNWHGMTSLHHGVADSQRRLKVNL